MTRVRSARFDFRKGLNTAFSQDVLDYYELRYALNARLGQAGSIAKRSGTQRIHSSAIGSGGTVVGLTQWQPALGRQVVAIAGGNLYHKIQTDANFTSVASTLSTTVRPSFATHVIAGTPTLFFAEGTLRKWTGAALTNVSGAPAGALALATYKGRMFASVGTKTIYWSKIADPETWASPDGGQANVDTYDASGVIAMAPIGSSLLLFKNSSIARFTGVSQDNILIDQQTEGVAADVGTIAAKSVCRVEDVLFFLSDRGAYVASEAGVQAVGVKIEDVFDAAAMDQIPNAVAAYHKARREVWVFIPPSGATTNTRGYCLNVRQNAWTGPWDMSSAFAVAAICQHEMNDQSKTILLGGYDGFVRNGDVTTYGAKDDVVSAGTGGTAITMQLELPTLMFGDPSAIKSLSPTQWISADLKTSGALQVIATGDHVSGNQSVTISSGGAGVKQYQARPGTRGRRLTLTLKDATSEIIQINGVLLEANIVRRAS